MPKDTKNLGYIKALACESRGFVIKKEGVPIFDTPSKLTRQVFGLESEACGHLFEKSTKQATGFLFQRIGHATLAHFRKEFTHIQAFA